MIKIFMIFLISLFLPFACSQNIEKSDSERRLELAKGLETDFNKTMPCRIYLSGTTNTEMTIYLYDANEYFIRRFCQQDKTLKGMMDQGFGEVYISNAKGEEWSVIPNCGKKMK